MRLPNPGSPEVIERFPIVTSGAMKAGTQRSTGGGYHGNFPGEATATDTYADSGSAARFFYCAKACREEREAGLRQMEAKTAGVKNASGRGYSETDPYRKIKARNHHPTVKPIALMRYLCRLTRTPKGGTVLDPFMGSGSTGCAAVMEHREFIGIDIEPEYVEIAKKRIAYWFEVGSQTAVNFGDEI